MDEQLEVFVRRALADGPRTLEDLHRRLASTVPGLAVRGTGWLEWTLVRSGLVTRSGDRYSLRAEDVDQLVIDLGEDLSERPDAPELLWARQVVVFDLETNADRANPVDHEIIEIGAIRVEHGITTARFHTLVAPTRPLGDVTRAVTGLTDADLSGAPALADALEGFAAFVGRAPLVAHNGFGYDFLVLDASYSSAELEAPAGPRLDSLDLAHLVFPRAGEQMPTDVAGELALPGRTLAQLAEHYGVTPEGDTHRAVVDATLTVAVVGHLLEWLLGEDARARATQHVLAAAAHPWLAASEAFRGRRPELPTERPNLLDVVPSAGTFPALEPTHALDVDAVVAPLEPGGALLAGRSFRPQQVEMARAVVRALARDEKLLLEAPTGTGKTFAYLLPAIAAARCHGSPVVIATHSKVLQNQVLSALDDLRDELGPVRSVLLKGKDNYLSLEALDAALDEPPVDPDEALALAIVVSWAAITPTGEWDDLRTWAIERHLPQLAHLRWRTFVDSGSVIATNELEERCFFRRALAALPDSEVAVLNHAVLVSRSDWLDHVGHVVLDEAHNLEESATAALTVEATEAETRRILDGIHSRHRRWGALARWCDATGTSIRELEPRRVLEALTEAREAVAELTGSLTEFLRGRAGVRRGDIERFGASLHLLPFERRRESFVPVRAATARLTAALRDVAQTLGALPVPQQLRRHYRPQSLARELIRLGRLARETAQVVADTVYGTEDEAAWVPIADLRLQQDRYTWGLRRVPISVAPALAEVWGSLDSLVLTSATLRVNGRFDFLQRELGIAAARTRALDTPFSGLEEQELVWLTDHLPAPTGGLIDAFTIAQTDELARLLLVSRGRALALFAARARMEHARQHLQPLMDTHGLRVHCQGERPAPALIEEMRTDVAASLLATRSFWEGVDIPGEALSLLVIEKLPFDSPADPLIAARMARLELMNQDPFTEFLVPRAALRFTQGVGRLIRSNDDRGAVVVLDKRLRRPTGYREAFLDSLPGPPSFAYPTSAVEGYRAVAQHLGVPFDDATEALLDSLPTSDPWAFLDALQISDEEAGDEEVVRSRLESLRGHLGFESWRPGQLEAMVRLIRGDDVVAILPTGSGKSLTFQLPALLRPGLTLVISPLVALMRDQVRGLRSQGLTGVGELSHGTSLSEQEETLARVRSGQVRLLYVSPERLWTQRFRSALQGVDLARVVVDEAHCVSEWGHTFRPEYGAITDAVREIVGETSRRPSIAAVTATATAEVRKEVVELLELPEFDPILVDPDRPELRYHVVDCADRQDREVMVARVVEAFRDQSVIVYVPRRQDAHDLAAFLRAANHRARAYHGGLEREERTHTEEAFLDGEAAVIVATKAFGLGIDKPDIAAVVHLEMPASVEEYVQETGRAARGARNGVGPSTGTCVLLRTSRDCGIHRTFIKHAAPSLDVVRDAYGAVSDSFVGPLDSLLPDRDVEEIELSISYLVRAGALERDPDLAWRGRVTVPRDARRTLQRVSAADPALAARGELLLDQIDHMGRQDYEAEAWSARTGIPSADLELSLLELDRRGVVGFVNWEKAWQLRRTSQSPDWTELGRAISRRRSRVEDLAANAKRYRSQDDTCRRSWLLWYLDGDADGSCDACDVCVPHLPAPWTRISITRDDLVASLPTEFVVLGLARRLERHGFGRSTLELVLLGAKLKHNVHLADEPGYGALRVLGPAGVTEKVDELIDRSLLDEVVLERGGDGYAAVALTEAGRAALG